MKNDISALMDKGFDIASLKELFDFVDDKGAVDSKLFVILNYDSLNAEFEKLSYELAELNANVIFYKPVLS